MKRFLFMTALSLSALFAHPVFADGHGKAGIHVMKPWARATPPGAANGAVFMTLMNKSQKSDRLLSVSSPVATKAELHTHKMDGVVMRMRHVEAITVGSNSTKMLKPGGFHVMLFGLKKPLKKGQTFSMTLKFEHAGTKIIDVTVHKIGAMKPSSSSGMHHKH